MKRLARLSHAVVEKQCRHAVQGLKKPVAAAEPDHQVSPEQMAGEQSLEKGPAESTLFITDERWGPLQL